MTYRMMARFRFQSLRPINRIKHVIDFSAALAGGTQIDNVLAGATDTPTLGVTSSVETGSKINGIYLRVEIGSNEIASAGAVPQCYLAIVKNPGGNITEPGANVVGASDNKRFVIHQEMIMLENTGKGGNPRTLFNGVIAIPKGYRRFAPNDQLILSLLSPALDIVFCFQCHYKEFR